MTEQPSVPDRVAPVLALADQLRESPGDAAVASSLADQCRDRPWLGRIPTAVEAAVDAMLQFLRQDPGGSDSPLQLVPSALEPPSALLAFHMVFPNAEFHPQSAGEPDPRTPPHPGNEAVWRYDGLTAIPAVEPPSAEAADRVRVLAAAEWAYISDIHRQAGALAVVPLHDLLGVLVHPPAPPADGRSWRPDAWLRAVQVVACLGIAHHRADQPWRESARSRVLASLYLGVEDWVVEAAGFAMVASAWVHPEIRSDVGAAIAFRWSLAEAAARTRGVSILGSLTELVLACPWLDERVTAHARDLLARLRTTAPEPLPPGRAEEMLDIARSHARDKRSRRRFPFGR